jgi:peptidoglycan/LPS O-acetylase OafA/YrhL
MNRIDTISKTETMAPSMATVPYEISTTRVAPMTGRAPRRFYAPELDALRFLAFMLVFCRHVITSFGLAQRSQAIARLAPTAVVDTAAGPTLSSGWALVQGIAQSFDFGVCLFFFLSSFLITRLLLVERESTGTVAVRNFYMRRILRIWPLYFGFLALIVLLTPVFPSLAVSPPRVLAAILFVANWAAVWNGWAGMSIQALWSVSMEEQFYIVWPLLARYGRKAVIVLSIAFALLSLGTLFYLGHRSGTVVTQIWPNTLVQSLFFAGGALTAVFSTPETRVLHPALRALSIVTGFLCWTIASVYCHVVRSESPGAALLIAGFLLVLLGTYLIFTGVAGWRKPTIPASMVYLGKISYGLYVFHVACLLITEHWGLAIANSLHLKAPLTITQSTSGLFGLLLTIGCAALSYRFLEMPFLALKHRFTVVQSRPD